MLALTSSDIQTPSPRPPQPRCPLRLSPSHHKPLILTLINPNPNPNQPRRACARRHAFGPIRVAQLGHKPSLAPACAPRRSAALPKLGHVNKAPPLYTLVPWCIVPCTQRVSSVECGEPLYSMCTPYSVSGHGRVCVLREYFSTHNSQAVSGLSVSLSLSIAVFAVHQRRHVYVRTVTPRSPAAAALDPCAPWP